MPSDLLTQQPSGQDDLLYNVYIKQGSVIAHLSTKLLLASLRAAKDDPRVCNARLY
jgi:hypothetical protein